MKYYIKGNYYFDIDHLNQFRVTGPGNHLFVGWSIPKETELLVEGYEMVDNRLVIELIFSQRSLATGLPLVTDIRTLRKHTEQANPRPRYDDLIKTGIKEVQPQNVKLVHSEQKPSVRLFNEYMDEHRVVRRYGVELVFPRGAEVMIEDDILLCNYHKNISCQVRVISNLESKLPGSHIFRKDEELAGISDEVLMDLYHECERQIEHLITTEKTSSFEYGTIFPRDWIESADLGRNDLSQSTIDFMYQESMKHVSESGEGWHEEIIGQFRSVTSDQSQHIDRKMVDIEPRYIMGFYNLSKEFLTNEKNRNTLYLVSQYILRNAEQQDFITFKKVADSPHEYHFVGNWRDSYLAFPRQKSPLAPYDVNCVFYPVSLRIIRRYAEYFYVSNLHVLNEIIAKWDEQKAKFRLYHPHGIIGYSLALHGNKNRPLPIAHLDESYDLYYGTPSLEEVVSFAKKLVDPDYFYTPVGPVLVSLDDEDFTTQQYHGKVIWPKQAAYAVAGLAKQFRRGQEEYWPWQVMNTLRESLVTTCHACFRGWKELGAVPELYYYDEKEDRARFYTDQENYEGQMSLIQLWSAVGCRRIIREYSKMMSML